MLDADYRRLLARATAATTVRELRAIAVEARTAFPDDAAAELVDSTCFYLAAGIIERGPQPATVRLALVPARAPAGVPFNATTCAGR